MLEAVLADQKNISACPSPLIGTDAKAVCFYRTRHYRAVHRKVLAHFTKCRNATHLHLRVCQIVCNQLGARTSIDVTGDTPQHTEPHHRVMLHRC
jgi:hypothetical protein